MDFSFSTDPRFLGCIRRHFVALGGTLHDLNEQGEVIGERHFCCSAFIIDICGVWCLLTAGHIFKEIDKGVEQKKIRLLKFGISDYFNELAINKDSYAYDYSEHRIDVDEEGIDFALLPLRDYYRNLMTANGVIPIPVAAWVGQSPPVFHSYALLGIPDEKQVAVEREGDRGPQIGHEVCLTMVGIEAMETPPADQIISNVPRFAGYLRDNDVLESAKGLSGGPIIGINRLEDGGWEYGCVAVQGSWLDVRRIVLGTPAHIIAGTMTRLLLANKAN